MSQVFYAHTFHFCSLYLLGITRPQACSTLTIVGLQSDGTVLHCHQQRVRIPTFLHSYQHLFIVLFLFFYFSSCAEYGVVSCCGFNLRFHED